jgi:hypothetical protein
MAATTHEFTRGIDYSAIVATSERVAWAVDEEDYYGHFGGASGSLPS